PACGFGTRRRSERLWMPCLFLLKAKVWLWWIAGAISGDDADDVVFAHVQQILAVQLEFLARVLAEQDLVAGLDAHRDDLAVVVGLAVAGKDNFALRWLFGRGVGVDDAAGGVALFFLRLDDLAIVLSVDFLFII